MQPEGLKAADHFSCPFRTLQVMTLQKGSKHSGPILPLKPSFTAITTTQENRIAMCKRQNDMQMCAITYYFGKCVAP